MVGRSPITDNVCINISGTKETILDYLIILSIKAKHFYSFTTSFDGFYMQPTRFDVMTKQ